MDLQLADRTVVIAGAGGDIGTALVRAFADEGARVLAASLEPDAAADVEAVAIDLARPGAPEELVGHAERTHGRVDVLVNDVGPIELHPEGFLGVDAADLRRVLELNLLVAARTCRAVLPGMVARGGGSIVNLASVAAHRPVVPLAHYSAAKAALVNLTTCLAQEFGRYGVRVNAVSPSPIAAPGRRPVLDVANATGRPNTPEEVALLVVMISSPRLPNLTGVDHAIDGCVTGLGS